MKDIRRIAINVISGGGGYFLPMFINFLAAPIILSKLGKEAFGLQSLVNVIIGYLMIADMGLDIPVTHKVAEYNTLADTGKTSKFLIATLRIYIVIGMFGAALLLMFNNKIISIFEIQPGTLNEAKIVFRMSALGFLCSVIMLWGKAVFNGLHRYEIANGVNIFGSILGVALGLILIWNGFGIVGLFGARVLGLTVASVLYVILIKPKIESFSLFPVVDLDVWNLLKRQIGYGALLRLSGMIFARMDQTLIGIWISVSAVTVYSFPILIATALSGLIGSLAHFSFPLVSSMVVTHAPSEIQSFFVNTTRFVVSASTVAYVPFIVLGDKFLGLWVNQQLASEGSFVMICLVSSFYLNSSLNTGLNSFITGMGQLKYFTSYSITRGIVLLLGFLILIRLYGINGAGIAYLFIVLFDAVFVIYTVRKKFQFRIATLFKEAYLKPVLLGVLLALPLFFQRHMVSTWFELIVAFALYAILYVAMAFLIGIVTKEEKKILRSFFTKT